MTNEKTYSYFAFITVLTPMYLSSITEALLSFGFLVEPATADKISVFTTPDLLSSLISLRLYTTDSDVGNVYKYVKQCLNEENVLHYSLVIVDGSAGAMFNIGNITINSKIPEKTVPN